MEKGMNEGKVCKCPHHSMVGWLLVLIGLDFLLGALHIFTPGFVSIVWPILLIVFGFMKMKRCNCC